MSTTSVSGEAVGEVAPAKDIAAIPTALALVLLCQLPYIVLYFNNLRGYSHYDFFPMALGCFGVLVWKRWGGVYVGGKVRRFFAFSLIALSGVSCLLAIAFSSPWIAYFAFLLATLAILSGIRDGISNRSLAPLIILLAILWQPPYGPNMTGDVVFTGSLQRACTRFVSTSLDFLNVPHLNSGTIITLEGQELGVEEACSGVQSLFFYLATAGFWAVLNRRTWVQVLVLMSSAVFWAFFTNSLRILIIALAFQWFEYDLTHGWVHDLLGYAMMILGVLLIWTSDLGLTAFSKVHNELVNQKAAAKTIAKAAPRRFPVFEPSMWAWGIFAIFALLFTVEVFDAATAYSKNRKYVDFFVGNPMRELVKDDLPNVLAGWKLKEYLRDDRSKGSDLGERSDTWIYEKDNRELTISFDQAFPGWHELTHCYENDGWKRLDRTVSGLAIASNSAISDNSSVFASFQHPTGKFGLIDFVMLDERSQLLEPPGKWDAMSSLANRVKNRLAPAIRSRLFGGTAYQVQCLILSDSREEQVALKMEVAKVLSESIPIFQKKILAKSGEE